MSARHVPVMLSEVVAAIAPRDGGVYVDGTFGAGGYSAAILDAAACKVFGIDRDPEAIASGEALRRRYESRLDLIQGRFGDMVTLSVDPEGRFVFPSALREHAKLEDTAVFVGRGRTFQILNPSIRTESRDQAKAKIGAQSLSLTSLFFDEGTS